MKLNIKEIKLNDHNPRDITPEQFAKLKKSLQEFPQMLETRPLVIDENNVVLGGNMRLRVLQDLGFEDVPVKQVTGWTEEQKKEFIVKDNLSYGMWDWEMLANEWDAEQLEDWGLEVQNWEEEPSLDELIGEEKNKPPTMKITFKTVEQLQKAENDIQELINRKYNGAFYSVSVGEL
jgi:ParB-like chromosome segregation protein Spo0J